MTEQIAVNWKDKHTRDAEYIRDQLKKINPDDRWLVRYAYVAGTSMGLEWIGFDDAAQEMRLIMMEAGE